MVKTIKDTESKKKLITKCWERANKVYVAKS